MPVGPPDGIVRKVVAAYPTASLVMLSHRWQLAQALARERNHVRGTLKGVATASAGGLRSEGRESRRWRVVYTSGDDRIFPRAFRLPGHRSAPGKRFKEIYVNPAGSARGADRI